MSDQFKWDSGKDPENGVSDHGELDGLGDNDHPQYVLASELLDLVYPVGSVYISVNSVSPATLFGGTWAAFGAGRVMVGRDASDADFDTVEETGGEKADNVSIAHTHSVGVGNHKHVMPVGFDPNKTYRSMTSDGWGNPAYGSIVIQAPRGGSHTPGLGAGTQDYWVRLGLTDNPYGASNVTSGGASVSSINPSTVQPYIVVNMWKRTA